MPGTHWRQSQTTFDIRATKNYQLSTKSTELNLFNFGDNVDRDTSTKSNEPATVDFRQTGDKLFSLLTV